MIRPPDRRDEPADDALALGDEDAGRAPLPTDNAAARPAAPDPTMTRSTSRSAAMAGPDQRGMSRHGTSLSTRGSGGRPRTRFTDDVPLDLVRAACDAVAGCPEHVLAPGVGAPPPPVSATSEGPEDLPDDVERNEGHAVRSTAACPASPRGRGSRPARTRVGEHAG